MIWIYIGGGLCLAIVIAFALATHNIMKACDQQEGYENEGGIKL
jgi:hypothetical protein